MLERSSLNDNAVATLLRINKISAAMELQDEKDRHSVFLMGKGNIGERESEAQRNSKQTTTLQIQNHGQKDPVIGLENNCLSHSLGPANDLVLKAFKMACLSYQPSDVPLESNTFTRTQLIEKKNELVRQCLQRMKHLDLPPAEHSHDGEHSLYSLKVQPVKPIHLVPTSFGNEEPPQTGRSLLDERVFSAIGESTDYESMDVQNKVRT